MKKIGVLSFILSSLLISSLSANEINNEDIEKKVFINVDSKGGAEILSSELEYKQYLDKKLEFSLKEQERISKLEAQCNQISNLKLAVAKLIKLSEESDSKSNSELTNEIKFLKNEIDKLNKANELLKLENDTFRSDLINLNSAINKLGKSNSSEANNIVKKEIATPIKKEVSTPIINISPEKTSAPSCKTKTILDIDKEELAHSYFKFKELKEFTIAATNNTFLYEYPLVESKTIGSLDKGNKYYADMYTAGGWVHFKNEGWVKGYLLYPQFNQIENKNNGDLLKSSVIKKIEVKECDK